MQCKDIMANPPPHLLDTDSVEDAAKIMAEQHVGFLLVYGAKQNLVGTLTDRDIVLRVVARGGSLKNQVGTVMTTEVVCCSANVDVQEANRLMRANAVSRIACKDENGHVVGIINRLKYLKHNGADTAGLLWQDTLLPRRALQHND